MKINWKVRVMNKMFWLAIIPMVLLLIQQVAHLFGIELTIVDLSDKLLAIVNTVFMILATLGIVADPTTEGLGDSSRAMLYSLPHKDE